jgi:hypothetical protein
MHIITEKFNLRIRAEGAQGQSQSPRIYILLHINHTTTTHKKPAVRKPLVLFVLTLSGKLELI